MNKIKNVTQSVTLILQLVLIVFVFYVIGRFMYLAGFISAVDILYPTKPVGFWILLVMSRLIYGSVCFLLLRHIFIKLTEKEFFWRAPSEDYAYRNEKGYKDVSLIIIFGTAAILILTALSDLILRVISFGLPVDIFYF